MEGSGGLTTDTVAVKSTIRLRCDRLGAPHRSVARTHETGRRSPAITMERQEFDAEYVRLLTDGDASVERHFTAYFSEFLNIKLRRRFYGTSEIEDIRQETFLRVLQALRQKRALEHPERLGAFVNSVCNNIIFEFIKARARHPSFDPAEYDPVDHTIDMDGNVLAEENRKMVRLILNGLPEADHTLLKMVFLDEMDRDEVCRVMNVDRGYLRVLLHRALTRFKELKDKGKS